MLAIAARGGTRAGNELIVQALSRELLTAEDISPTGAQTREAPGPKGDRAKSSNTRASLA